MIKCTDYICYLLEDIEWNNNKLIEILINILFNPDNFIRILIFYILFLWKYYLKK